MSDKVFYSWQSDLPNASNRGFIQTALEAATRTLREDDSIEVEPVVDRDTFGIPGCPDIAATIFGKIDEAQAFVCDVSVINQGHADKQRPTPNPNVLIELGYALKVLGAHRIIMVMNTAFGAVEQLPFDLRLKRVVPYHMPAEAEGRATERKKLQQILEANLREMFAAPFARRVTADIQPRPLVEQARQAVEEAKANRVALVSRYMQSLAADLAQQAPDLSKADKEKVDEPLVAALSQSEDQVCHFADLCETIAAMRDQEAAHALYSGFGSILEGYDLPPGVSGTFLRVQFDFHKFLGHEFFVIFISKLIGHERWDVLAGLLQDGIYVTNANQGRDAMVSFEYICHDVELLHYRNQRLRCNFASLHAEMLKERHTTGNLGVACPLEHFTEAEFFLFLRSVGTAPQEGRRLRLWFPHSAIYLRRSPRFLVRARSSRYAKAVLPALDFDSIVSFQTKLNGALMRLAEMWERRGALPFLDITPNEIGSDLLVR